MTGPTPPVRPDDMPEGWEEAARAGWESNPAARAFQFGRAAHNAYVEAVRQWKVSIARTMASALDVSVESMVGQPLPVWDDLAPELQGAWVAAALAARGADV